MKRRAYIFLACIMTLLMSVTSFAATVPGTGEAKIETNDTTLSIEKYLIAKNQSLQKVAGPGITFTFEVAPETTLLGTTTDSNNITTSILTGPADGLVLTGNPSFAKTELLNCSASGVTNTKLITFDVNLDKFSKPGVYRYKVTDTTTEEAYAVAGVTRLPGEDIIRYIDVYIENGASGLQVRGFVVQAENPEGTGLVKKIFDPSIFETYNLELTKTVTGNMGDRNNQFPFEITLSDNGRPFYAAKEQSLSGTEPNQSADTTSLSTTLAHNEKYHLAGLTKNAAIALKETNNTSDIYHSTVTGETEATVLPAGEIKTLSLSDISSTPNVEFNDNLDAPSPTGVVLRFGASFIILMAGIACLMLSRKAKQK